MRLAVHSRRASTQSCPSGLNHQEPTDQAPSKVADRLHDGDAEGSARPGRESDQDDPASRLMIGVDELAKVLILGEQDSPACPSKLKNYFVGSTADDFGDRDYVVTVGTQSAHGCEVTALIRQELHRLGA
jgi:hypothetical protein